MKQIINLVVVLSFCIKLTAQTSIISGQVKNLKDSSLTIYLLYAGAHYHNQYINLPLNNSGGFEKVVHLPYPVFALLKYNGRERRLLLSPGRNLNMVFDAAENEADIKIFGTAAKENTLLYQLKIGDMPFFMGSSGQENEYAKMPLDSLMDKVVKKVKSNFIDADRKIAKTEIPQNLQRILSTEYRYVHQCYLYDFAANNMRWAKNKDQETFLDKVINFEPLPDSSTLVNCLFSNMMLDNYIRYRLINAGKDFRTDSTAAKQRIERLLQISYPEIMRQAERYGERYILNWLYAKQQLSHTLQDKILFNRIIESCDNKLFSTAKTLQDTLQRYFPYSHYLDMAKVEVDKLQLLLEQQKENPKITLHAGRKIQSLKELVEPYKGKVVYIDIWGSWCGPCRDEMQYAPDLKKKYAGKDIVFVYLDMDEDNKDAAWKEMLHLYSLEGEHYRLNSTEIQSCWKEVEQAGGETNRYPTYVLFDKNGKMIRANAERPSSKDKLYKQLDENL